MSNNADPANEASAAAAQTWDPARYARNARFVADLAGAAVELLAPQAGERILDLGCGDGALSVKLQEMGVEVVGVDASAEQIEAARAAGVAARVMDGQALDFSGEFDAVVSNAAMHWMNRDPDAVIAGVHRALRPRGRFVAEFGGYANCAAARVALYAALRHRGCDPEAANPWYFPSPAEYGARLARGGFAVDSIELVPRLTRLPGDITGWLDTFADSFFNLLPEAEREPARQEVRALLLPMLCDGEGTWHVDYMRLRFSAHLPD